jgi:hypothetical protein
VSRYAYTLRVVIPSRPYRDPCTLAIVKTPAERLRDTFRETVRGIERRQDLDRAWREAAELGDAVADIRGEVADLRARLARRIANRDKLSLADLAKRISVSRGRAAQLMRAGRDEGNDDDA